MSEAEKSRPRTLADLLSGIDLNTITVDDAGRIASTDPRTIESLRGLGDQLGTTSLFDQNARQCSCTNSGCGKV